MIDYLIHFFTYNKIYLFTAAFFCDPGETRDLQVDAQDPDGDVLTYELLSGPGSINENTGLITYTVDAPVSLSSK